MTFFASCLSSNSHDTNSVMTRKIIITVVTTIVIMSNCAFRCVPSLVNAWQILFPRLVCPALLRGILHGWQPKTLLHSVQEAGEHLGRVILQESAELKSERRDLENERDQAGQQRTSHIFSVHSVRLLCVPGARWFCCQ